MGVKSFLEAGSRRAITGFLLIVLATFLLISLASHNPKDIALFDRDVLLEQQAASEDEIPYFSQLLKTTPENAAGIAGALLSHWVLFAVGRSAYILLIVMILVGWQLLFEYEVQYLRNKLLEASVSFLLWESSFTSSISISWI